MNRLFALDDTVTSDDWYTPAWIFDGLDLTFDLDVCAPSGGPMHVPAERWFSLTDDGLERDWQGLVWCNPPYSAPGRWCRRWAQHRDGGCLLIKQELSARGPLEAWSMATSCYVPSGRIQFVNPDGVVVDRVPFATILLGKGEHADRGLFRLSRRYGGATRLLGAGAAA